MTAKWKQHTEMPSNLWAAAARLHSDIRNWVASSEAGCSMELPAMTDIRFRKPILSICEGTYNLAVQKLKKWRFVVTKVFSKCLSSLLQRITSFLPNGLSSQAILLKAFPPLPENLSGGSKVPGKGKERESRMKQKKANDSWKGKDRQGHGIPTGNIVGKSADPIGEENKGHKMLLKMGWGKGTALGRDGNTGIIDPVQVQIRQKRAGLGVE